MFYLFGIGSGDLSYVELKVGMIHSSSEQHGTSHQALLVICFQLRELSDPDTLACSDPDAS